jgi:hypothetical protein
MLEGLDDLAWDGLLHAYGPADDLPELIRAAASADEAEADGAVEELFHSVCHQGLTVYPASVAAVPFVAELAAARAVHRRSTLLYLLGAMADPHDANGVEAAAVRDAVTAQVPRLLPRLADPDAGVRETAAFTLARCPEAGAPVLARLRERLEVEDGPLARASLLAAGARLDAAGWADLLSAALGHASPAVRAAAALAIARAGLPWPGQGTAAVVEAYRDGDPLEGWVWTGGDDTLADLLNRFDDLDAVPAAVLGALAGAATVEARWSAACAVQTLCKIRRSAPAKLLPLLGPLLADGHHGVQLTAARTVRVAGGAAGALVADQLAALAARCAYGDEAERWEPAAEALRALVQLGDPRWRRPLLAAWRTGWVPDNAGDALRGAAVAADPELLAAVRARLTRIAESLPANDECGELALLLKSWGPAAAPAVPELLAALEHGSAVASAALAAVGPAASAALPALRLAAGRDDLDAAAAVWRLAGDPGPLLAVVGRALDHDRVEDVTIARLLELGGHARPLLPRLQRFLTGEPARSFPARHTQVAAATVAWRLTGDPDAVVPTVRAVLAGGETSAGAAARLAAELGDHARPLLPLLRAALDDRWARVHAARALWRLGGDAGDLVEPLVAAAAECYGGGEVAVDLLVEMRATAALPRLRALAEQDARIVNSGIYDYTVWQDERLRARLWQAVERLSA